MLDEPDALWLGERVLLDDRDDVHRLAAMDDRLHDDPGSPPFLLATMTLA